VLAGPGVGEFFAVAAWWLTPPLARAVLGAARLLRRRPLGPDQAVNWQIWANAHYDHGPLWRSFLTEQRALVRELDGLTAALPAVTQPVLLVADTHDMIIPVRSTRRLAAALPGAQVQMLAGSGHHLPRRAAPQIAAAIAEFLGALDSRDAAA
jgi:pimeloyl-ACP methyl ester carboxylesterase